MSDTSDAFTPTTLDRIKAYIERRTQLHDEWLLAHPKAATTLRQLEKLDAKHRHLSARERALLATIRTQLRRAMQAAEIILS